MFTFAVQDTKGVGAAATLAVFTQVLAALLQKPLHCFLE